MFLQSNSHLQSQEKNLSQKMTTAQVVKMLVTNNSLSKDYPHMEDHAKQITVHVLLCTFYFFNYL